MNDDDKTLTFNAPWYLVLGILVGLMALSYWLGTGSKHSCPCPCEPSRSPQVP
jgi:hypothetical protein